MKHEKPALEARLRDLPAGGVTVISHPDAGEPQILLTEQYAVKTDGKGCCEVYSVFPGVDVSYDTFLASEVNVCHPASPGVLEVFYCRSGRIGWNMLGGTAMYLGAGDMTVHSAACCAKSAMMFPVGYAEGISISMDLAKLQESCPAILREAGVELQGLQAAFCAGKPTAISACPDLERIFAPLYAAAPARRRPYLQLKVQELLLLLLELPAGRRKTTQYYSRQTEVIREIHRQLTEHLDRRFTIEALSKQYLLNTSTLKEVFKAVYGLPIATYMKEYRVQQAQKLLRETDAPVAEIARQVGYESQGKFSEAFKDVTQMLPTEYRKTMVRGT